MRNLLSRMYSASCYPACLLTERWFFREVGGWRERIATHFVGRYYGNRGQWK